MKRCKIIFADDSKEPDTITGKDAFELDFNALASRARRYHNTRINAIEFYHEGVLVGTIMFSL